MKYTLSLVTTFMFIYLFSFFLVPDEQTVTGCIFSFTNTRYQLHPIKTRSDSDPINTNGDIVRSRSNGRVGKKRNLLFPPSHYPLLTTIYSDEKSGNESERRF